MALTSAKFDPLTIKTSEVIPERSMGDSNTVYQLQNYIVGLSPEGLKLQADGTLDVQEKLCEG
ncbi:MAG: hypothetical protein WKF84_06850 [Pyrinomonadaceae bacterium]